MRPPPPQPHQVRRARYMDHSLVAIGYVKANLVTKTYEHYYLGARARCGAVQESSTIVIGRV